MVCSINTTPLYTGWLDSLLNHAGVDIFVTFSPLLSCVMHRSLLILRPKATSSIALPTHHKEGKNIGNDEHDATGSFQKNIAYIILGLFLIV